MAGPVAMGTPGLRAPVWLPGSWGRGKGSLEQRNWHPDQLVGGGGGSRAPGRGRCWLEATWDPGQGQTSGALRCCGLGARLEGPGAPFLGQGLLGHPLIHARVTQPPCLCPQPLEGLLTPSPPPGCGSGVCRVPRYSSMRGLVTHFPLSHFPGNLPEAKPQDHEAPGWAWLGGESAGTADSGPCEPVWEPRRVSSSQECWQGSQPGGRGAPAPDHGGRPLAARSPAPCGSAHRGPTFPDQRSPELPPGLWSLLQALG